MKREDFKAEDLDNGEVDVVVDDELEIADDNNSDEQESHDQPFWLQEDDAADEDDSVGGKTVPLAVLLKEKSKRKERDSELEELKQEIDKLKQTGVKPMQAVAKRPRIHDFDNDEAYEQAMDTWEQQQRDQILETINGRQHQSKTDQRIQQEVGQFYTNAEKLIKDHAISPEVYVSASNNIVDSLDQIHPGKGKSMFHALVATVGDHAEKIVFHVGRNKAALAEFQSHLLSDPSGSRALVYLGSLKAKVAGNTKKSSRAPAPAAHVAGGDTGGNKGDAERRKYEAAHKSDNIQKAYNIKKAARQAGIDTSNGKVILCH